MKKLLFVLTMLAMLYPVFSIAQETEEIYSIADVMPEFPGKEEGLKKYISENIKYPEEAKKQGIEGNVFVKFAVGKTGKIIQSEIAKSPNELLNTEALRVINSLPDWKPAIKDGKAVAVWYVVPIKFALEEKVLSDKIDGEEVFYVVENAPVFPGGDDSLKSYVAHHVVYPKEALQNNISGKVFVRFVVDKKGNVRNAEIVRGVDPLLDAEALRVINSLPQWKPGSQGGKDVNVWFTMPINYAFN
jgi:TonB family protein